MGELGADELVAAVENDIDPELIEDEVARAAEAFTLFTIVFEGAASEDLVKAELQGKLPLLVQAALSFDLVEASLLERIIENVLVEKSDIVDEVLTALEEEMLANAGAEPEDDPIEVLSEILSSHLPADVPGPLKKKLLEGIVKVLPKIVGVAVSLYDDEDVAVADVVANVVDKLRGKIQTLVDALLHAQGQDVDADIPVDTKRKGGDELPPLQALAAALGLNNEDEDPEDIKDAIEAAVEAQCPDDEDLRDGGKDKLKKLKLGGAVKDLIALQFLQSVLSDDDIDIDAIKEAAIDEVAEFACMAKEASMEITKRNKGGPGGKEPGAGDKGEGAGDKEEGEGGKKLPPPLQALAGVLGIAETEIKAAVEAELGDDLKAGIEAKLGDLGCLPDATRKKDAAEMLPGALKDLIALKLLSETAIAGDVVDTPLLEDVVKDALSQVVELACKAKDIKDALAPAAEPALATRIMQLLRAMEVK